MNYTKLGYYFLSERKVGRNGNAIFSIDTVTQRSASSLRTKTPKASYTRPAKLNAAFSGALCLCCAPLRSWSLLKKTPA